MQTALAPACRARLGVARRRPFSGGGRVGGSSSSTIQAAARPLQQQRVRAVSVSARATIKDASSGVEFALAERFWEGDAFRCLGAVSRSKKILVVRVPVYSVAFYAEADLAAKELGVRDRGGFFEGDGDFCSALVDGAFGKALVFEMLRDLEGKQFADAVNDALGPRMALTGDAASLEAFVGFFAGAKLAKGSRIVALWTKGGELEVELLSPTDAAPVGGADLQAIAPKNRIPSEGFARALFELFLGDASVVPEARAAWARGARELLESERVKRESRRAGGG